MGSDEQTNTKKVDSAETISSPAAATTEGINSSSKHENSQETAVLVLIPKKKLITSASNHSLQQTSTYDQFLSPLIYLFLLHLVIKDCNSNFITNFFVNFFFIKKK